MVLDQTYYGHRQFISSVLNGQQKWLIETWAIPKPVLELCSCLCLFVLSFYLSCKIGSWVCMELEMSEIGLKFKKNQEKVLKMKFSQKKENYRIEFTYASLVLVFVVLFVLLFCCLCLLSKDYC